MQNNEESVKIKKSRESIPKIIKGADYGKEKPSYTCICGGGGATRLRSSRCFDYVVSKIQHNLVLQKISRLLDNDKNIIAINKIQGKRKVQKKMKNIKAFTLAEMLITLGIIGVVATMTLTTLITKYQKKETAFRLKGAYSNINQAFQLAQAQIGPANLQSDFITVDKGKSGNELDEIAIKYFLPYLKVIKFCKSGTGTDCWIANRASPYSIDMIPTDLYNYDYSAMNCLCLANSTTACLYNSGYDKYIVSILIDVNGKKKPNRLGRDVFVLEPTYKLDGKYSVYQFPYTGSMTREKMLKNHCGKGSGSRNAGWMCGSLIMYDNWEIKNDYPW